MTMRDLEIFAAVAETGRIGEASSRLFLSQPTVSHVITQIEERYQVKLFERFSKQLHITAAGREFLQYARHILANFGDMERFLYHTSDRQIIRVGASLTVGSFFLPGIIAKFEKENPDIRTNVYIDNSKDIVKKIHDGTLAAAVIEGAADSEDVIAREVYEDEMVLICGRTHPFASRGSLRLEDLAGADFVLREEGSGTRAFLTDLTGSHGIPITEKWVCHSADSIINIVASGQGVSVISKAALADERRVVRVKIENMSLTRNFLMIYHRDKYLSPALLKLMEAFQKYFRLIQQESFLT